MSPEAQILGELDPGPKYWESLSPLGPMKSAPTQLLYSYFKQSNNVNMFYSICIILYFIPFIICYFIYVYQPRGHLCKTKISPGAIGGKARAQRGSCPLPPFWSRPCWPFKNYITLQVKESLTAWQGQTLRISCTQFVGLQSLLSCCSAVLSLLVWLNYLSRPTRSVFTKWQIKTNFIWTYNACIQAYPTKTVQAVQLEAAAFWTNGCRLHFTCYAHWKGGGGNCWHTFPFGCETCDTCLVGRGTCVWTTYLELLHANGTTESPTHDLQVASRL